LGNLSATGPLQIVSFFLTPQENRRTIAATSKKFSELGAKTSIANFNTMFEGGKSAVFAGMDRAMH
jgi:hypothetical protein